MAKVTWSQYTIHFGGSGGLKLVKIKGSEKILEMEGKLVFGRMFGLEIHLFV